MHLDQEVTTFSLPPGRISSTCWKSEYKIFCKGILLPLIIVAGRNFSKAFVSNILKFTIPMTLTSKYFHFSGVTMCEWDNGAGADACEDHDDVVAFSQAAKDGLADVTQVGNGYIT